MTKILVVEDDELIRFYVVRVLQEEKFDVISAENGLVGIVKAKKYLPDLIICDVHMPEKNGYEVLANLRSAPRTATIPFIFLTGQSAKEDMRHGMNLGADDYLTKPFEVEELFSAIQVRLKKHARFTKQMDDLRLNISFTMPHELRTPLTAIIGFAQLLSDPDMAEDKQQVLEMADAIYQSGIRLERIVENYLLYTNLRLMEYKSNAKKAFSREKPIETKNVIATFAKQKAEQMQRVDDLFLHLVDADVPISARNLKKIVEELVDNALKFSKPGSKVKIMTNIDSTYFSLIIINSGRGMTTEQIRNIGAYMQFERKHYEQQGSGLGIIIAKLLAELHDGDLTIESKPNEKTKVQIRLRTYL